MVADLIRDQILYPPAATEVDIPLSLCREAMNDDIICPFLGCVKQTLERGSEERPELNASPFHVSRGDVSFCDKPSFHARAIYRLSQAHDVIMQQLTSIS